MFLCNCSFIIKLLNLNAGDLTTLKRISDNLILINCKLKISIDDFIKTAEKYNRYNDRGRCHFKIREDIERFVINYIDPKIIIKVLKNRH